MTRTEPDPTVIRREILIDARVERVWNELPQAQVTLATRYSG